ncbi:MAG: hypothetical protein ABI150_12895 [Nitrobacter sp.]
MRSVVAWGGAVVLAGMVGIGEVVTSVAAAVTVVVLTSMVADIAAAVTWVAEDVMAEVVEWAMAGVTVAAMEAGGMEVGEDMAAATEAITRCPAGPAARGDSEIDKAEAPILGAFSLISTGTPATSAPRGKGVPRSVTDQRRICRRSRHGANCQAARSSSR